MSNNKSHAQRRAIKLAQERAAAGDQHYNHAWRSLDTAEERILAVARSHKERIVCSPRIDLDFKLSLTNILTEIGYLKAQVTQSAEIQREKEGR